jgi:hypothetical protein
MKGSKEEQKLAQLRGMLGGQFRDFVWEFHKKNLFFWMVWKTYSMNQLSIASTNYSMQFCTHQETL